MWTRNANSSVMGLAAAAMGVALLTGCDVLAPSSTATGGPVGPNSGPASLGGTGSAGGGAVAPAPITVTIVASKASNIRPGENVTFTARNVQGGVPPYTYFWIMDHDTAYTQTGPAFTRQIDNSAPKRTVSLVVRDSTNTDSAFFSVEVELEAPTIPAVSTVCGSMAGVWRTTYGSMRLTQNGNTVSGTYDYYCPGRITGTITSGPANSTACPDCLTWRGTWSEQGPDANGSACGPRSGSFEFTVDPDLGSFTGRWSKDGNSHWQADPWSGYHDTCGDGSPAGPRQ